MSKKKGGASLPSADLIEKEIVQQAHEKARADLVETDLVIHGSGTTALNSTGNVVDVLARNEQGRSLTLATTSVSPAATPAPTPSDDSSGNSGSGPVSSASPTPTSGPSATPNPSPTPNSSGSGDDDHKGKGDHNGDGHGDNGKGDHKPGHGHPLRLPPPAVDRGRPSDRERFSPTIKFSRNGH
jgi:hypothetical protein